MSCVDALGMPINITDAIQRVVSYNASLECSYKCGRYCDVARSVFDYYAAGNGSSTFTEECTSTNPCVTEPAQCAVLDTDSDGIVDADDKCPLDPNDVVNTLGLCMETLQGTTIVWRSVFFFVHMGTLPALLVTLLPWHLDGPVISTALTFAGQFDLESKRPIVAALWQSVLYSVMDVETLLQLALEQLPVAPVIVSRRKLQLGPSIDDFDIEDLVVESDEQVANTEVMIEVCDATEVLLSLPLSTLGHYCPGPTLHVGRCCERRERRRRDQNVGWYVTGTQLALCRAVNSDVAILLFCRFEQRGAICARSRTAFLIHYDDRCPNNHADCSRDNDDDSG